MTQVQQKLREQEALQTEVTGETEEEPVRKLEEDPLAQRLDAQRDEVEIVQMGEARIAALGKETTTVMVKDDTFEVQFCIEQKVVRELFPVMDLDSVRNQIQDRDTRDLAVSSPHIFWNVYLLKDNVDDDVLAMIKGSKLSVPEEEPKEVPTDNWVS